MTNPAWVDAFCMSVSSDLSFVKSLRAMPAPPPCLLAILVQYLAHWLSRYLYTYLGEVRAATQTMTDCYTRHQGPGDSPSQPQPPASTSDCAHAWLVSW